MRPAAMFTITPAMQARADTDGPTAEALRDLVATVLGGGDLRRPPKPWRATYPLDDPANTPDLWVARLEAGTVWCKCDGGHDNVQPEPDGTCTWCGAVHDEPRPLFTFLLPDDY